MPLLGWDGYRGAGSRGKTYKFYKSDKTDKIEDDFWLRIFLRLVERADGGRGVVLV